MNIDKKNIIVTGASSGIGKALVEQLSTYPNVKIVAAARRKQLIPQKENIYPISLDVSTEQGVDELFSFAQEKLEQIDIFIANAGFAYAEKIEKPDWIHISKIFDLNVLSPIYSLEKLAATNNSSPIHFVALISGVAYFPLPAYSLYCSTKNALKQFFETYQYEKRNNLTISTVYPIATYTEFFEKASKEKVSLPLLRQNKEIVAKKIIRGIIRDKKNIYPSFLFRICLPIIRVFPCIVKLYSLNEKRKIKHIL